MRVVIVGAGDHSVATARLLVERGHDVVLVDKDREHLEALQEVLDCGFLSGDGTRPTLLEEADPKSTDLIFCLTESDQTNIIASLVARSLGFPRVVTRIQDPEFEPICEELGLDETIVPVRTISRYLADVSEGIDVLELSTAIKHDARLFQFDVSPEDAVPIDELELPGDARLICFYRDGRLHIVDDRAEKLREGDTAVILARLDHLGELRSRWSPRVAGDEEDGG